MAYLYIELWTENDKWLKLTEQERQKLAQTRFNSLEAEGAQLLGFAVNEAQSGLHNIKRRWIATWKVPSKELVERFDKRVADPDSWFDYFDQESAYGPMSDDEKDAIRGVVKIGASAPPVGRGLKSQLGSMQSLLQTLEKQVAILVHEREKYRSDEEDDTEDEDESELERPEEEERREPKRPHRPATAKRKRDT